MSEPEFFAAAPSISVYDPLAEMLGAASDGTLTYHYADAVRLAGHSCPTVAGAYLTGRAALQALYPDAVPQRGSIAVHMPAPEEEGVSGVIAQVLTLLTGAAAAGGFKGLGGRFARNGLLTYAEHASDDDAIRFERLDNGAVVAVRFNARTVAGDPAIPELISVVVSGRATHEQQRVFAGAWQERVRRILLEHADDPEVVQVTSFAATSPA
ncbi:MAG TPA: hypothetical protein VK110_10375 [Salinisphaeraceae bacterium]|nr:hypothetical protein [Salinisphaeraceae bacterium]